MKIVLFQGGAPGVAYTLPEDEAVVPALMDLLDGEVESRPLCGRLMLVCRVGDPAEGDSLSWGEEEQGSGVSPARQGGANKADFARTRLETRYVMRRLGRAVEPLRGDVAVVSMGPGCLTDIRAGDVEAANHYIRPVGDEA